MQKYITQLLHDIKHTTHSKGFSQKEVKEKDIETYFAEVERFIHDTPTQRLGSQLGLQREQFPSAELLTIEQCAKLEEALQRCYYSYGIVLDMPNEIPAKSKYEFVVEALDRKVFLEAFGTHTIECCHYDFNGYCAFGVEKCPCYQEWAAEVAQIKQQPLEQLEEIAALDVYWFDFLTTYATCKVNFEQNGTPNKKLVEKTWQQLEQAYRTMHIEDISIYFGAKEEELPEGDYRTLFDWLGVGKVKFPKQSDLNDLELRLLAMALVQLIGKEFIVPHILAWPIEKQYEELVTHFSQWMKRKYPYFQLICQPKAITLYDKTTRTT